MIEGRALGAPHRSAGTGPPPSPRTVSGHCQHGPMRMHRSELVVANRVGSVPPEQLWVDALWRGAGAAFASRAWAQRALNRANAGMAELEATAERAQVAQHWLARRSSRLRPLPPQLSFWLLACRCRQRSILSPRDAPADPRQSGGHEYGNWH